MSDNDKSRTTVVYGLLSDLELVGLARGGDDSAFGAILDRYRDVIRFNARPYFVAGADRDDVLQEGLIGMFKAVQDYRRDRDTSFKTFLEVCISRQIITAVKSANRQKHMPLNSYTSLDCPVGDREEQGRSLAEVIPGTRTQDPADVVIGDEEALGIRVVFDSMLSDFETSVLRLYMNGRSYEEIASITDRHVKSVDNALQRVKRKVEKHRARREVLAETYRAPASGFNEAVN